MRDKPSIILYIEPGCQHCMWARNFLRGQNISFEVRDVTRDKATLKQLVERVKKIKCPIIDINGELVNGFDLKRICHLIENSRESKSALNT